MSFTAEHTGASGLSSGMRTGFRRYAWGVLAYNVLVILWGAYVRATGSGAGCGNHWPFCNGEVVPRAPKLETIIEFTHRLTSGLALLAVAGLLLWAFRQFPRGARVRATAALAAAFLLVEALLGAGLVLFEFVAHNASAGRAAYLSAHLVNTQLLLAALAVTAWLGGHPEARPGWRRTPPWLKAALGAALAVSVTGAIAALGDTLFPSASVAAGIRQEFSSASHTLVRLRWLHPAAAVLLSAVLVAAALRARRSPARSARKLGWMIGALVAAQLGAGVVNVLLLAPVWMQIFHLLLADLLWLALVVLALEAGESHPSHAAARAA